MGLLGICAWLCLAFLLMVGLNGSWRQAPAPGTATFVPFSLGWARWVTLLNQELATTMPKLQATNIYRRQITSSIGSLPFVIPQLAAKAEGEQMNFPASDLFPIRPEETRLESDTSALWAQTESHGVLLRGTWDRREGRGLWKNDRRGSRPNKGPSWHVGHPGQEAQRWSMASLASIPTAGSFTSW